MADSKKYRLERSRYVGDPDNALDELWLYWRIDDGTQEVDVVPNFMANLDPGDDIPAIALDLETDVNSRHSGGKIMAVGSYDLDNSVVT